MGDVPKPDGLDWMELSESMKKYHDPETGLQKVLRKCKENMFVPIGAVITVGALTYGLINFKRGNQEMQQKMMRLRVAAQLFTVSAAIGGVLYSLPKEKRNFTELWALGERQRTSRMPVQK